MSTTTITRQQTTPAHLADYEVHHSDTSSPARSASSSISSQDAPHNPPNWPTDHRRIPPHRPINIDPAHEAECRQYTSNAEHVFVVVMFTGVAQVAVCSFPFAFSDLCPATFHLKPVSMDYLPLSHNTFHDYLTYYMFKQANKESVPYAYDPRTTYHVSRIAKDQDFILLHIILII